MKILEGNVINRGVNINYLVSEPEKSMLTPLIIVPGLTESAEDYREIMYRLKNRKCIVISLRGRGQSDSPKTGYSLEDHIQDIERVIDEINLDEFILMGYSRGTSYMFGYALKYHYKLKGLIIGDYPAMHTRLPEQWVDWFVDLPSWRGKKALERMKRHALEGIQKESEEKLFWNDLHRIKSPILILGGGKEGAVLSDEMCKEYSKSTDNQEIVILEQSDHNLFEPDLEIFINTINNFMNKL